MSEFGSGLVVPLVKFSEHVVKGPWLTEVELAIQWQKMTPQEREAIQAYEGERWEVIMHRIDREDIEVVVAEYMALWANGAFDHLVEIEQSMAPQSLLDLTQMVKELRYMDRAGNAEDWAEIKRMWRQSALDLDEYLGVEADWGDTT
jgi:hypothetical protein